MALQTVLIIDDHPLVAESVAALVRSICTDHQIDVDIEIFHTLKNAQNFLAKGMMPHLIVTDLSLPDSKGIGTVEQILEQIRQSVGASAAPKFLVFSGVEHSVLKHQSLSLGAIAFITKSDDGKALRATLEKALHQKSVSNPFAVYPHGEVGPASHEVLSQALTRKQAQIWQDLAAGYSNAEIATRHGVGINTIKTHVKDIFDRIGARNRTEAAKLYFNRNKSGEATTELR
jgi:DNA-binding NarL/FixJ family response regulator